MKKECFAAAVIILIVSASFLLFGAIAAAYLVEVNVAEVISSEIKSADLSTDAFVALNYDVFNSGSAGYRLRLRADIYNNSRTGDAPAATIWTKELSFEPGERKPEAIYWYGGSGNYTARVRAYRAQEITDVGDVEIIPDVAAVPESIFTIEKVRIYGGEIKMRIKSSKDAENVVIYPAEYPAGWLFEQEQAGSIGAGRSAWITMRYEPSLFSERGVVMAIAGSSGKYYSEQAVGLKLEAGLSKYVHLFLDSFF